jgi:hypothetical protein
MKFIELLPQMIAEIESAKGKKLTNDQLGQLMHEVGDTIKSGEAAEIKVSGFLAHDPSCTGGGNSTHYIPCSSPSVTRTAPDLCCS